MKIIDIFDDQRLLSFHYSGETDNEYDRLMEEWTDVSKIREYAKREGITEKNKINYFIEKINNNAEIIQDWMYEIEQGNDQLDNYFEPIDNKESRKEEKLYRQQYIITKQKGKQNILRIYALRIDLDTYIITGGAIKRSQTMQQHPDTAKELEKLETACKYLIENEVFDKDSLIDLQDETS